MHKEYYHWRSGTPTGNSSNTGEHLCASGGYCCCIAFYSQTRFGICRTTKPAVRAVRQGKANEPIQIEAMITSLIRRCPRDMSEESCVCATSGPSDACRSYIRSIAVRELACEIERDRHPSATAASIKAASVLSQMSISSQTSISACSDPEKLTAVTAEPWINLFVKRRQAAPHAYIPTYTYIDI